MTLVIGIRLVDLTMGTSEIIAGALSAALLGILFNAVSTFIGAAWGKRSAALGGAIALAIAGFLFYSLVCPLLSMLPQFLFFSAETYRPNCQRVS